MKKPKLKKRYENSKSCETCIFEYSCDWTPAAGRVYCEDWRTDLLGLENDEERRDTEKIS